jgi:hypothetical protein
MALAISGPSATYMRTANPVSVLNLLAISTSFLLEHSVGAAFRTGNKVIGGEVHEIKAITPDNAG